MGKIEKVKIWGEGPATLVFLHYFGGSAASWRWVAERLADRYRCVAINLPGCGGAPALPEPSIAGFADEVRAVVRSLGIENYSLVGHSMGGKIALQVAADAPPGTVRHLVLIAPSPPTTEPMPEAEKQRMLQHPDRAVAEETVRNATRMELTAERHDLAVSTQLIIDPATWGWWLKTGMDHSIADHVRSLSVPTTVLASEDDPVITPAVIQERVLAVLADPRLRQTRAAGHLLPLEKPKWVAEKIHDALIFGRTQPTTP